MPPPQPGRIERLFSGIAPEVLRGNRYGIERECLRVSEDGSLAVTDHPAALGSALTNPYITTDFSEALVEFVTPPCESPWEVVQFLCDLHNFTHDHIGSEALWPLSMPCPVAGDDSVPLARYGSSNVGTMKTTYRRGLGHRYGRAMQTIAGVHFNFSPGNGFWRVLQDQARARVSTRAYQSAAYFALVRNFRRYAWLILYLFGASPAVCKSFLAGREHALVELDEDAWYLPHATSLRMSNLGYSSTAQASLNISLNSLDEYVAGLTRAIRTPYGPYQAIGVEVDGQWRQLSANVLQIANEFYSVVRPKRVAHSGEPPTVALRERGVEYVEIRALDINPNDPVGVSQRQIRFLECFLLYCAVAGDDIISAREQVAIDGNQALVAARGREPGLLLQRGDRAVPLAQWAQDICAALMPIAAALDSAHGNEGYRSALAHYLASVHDPELTPSALLLSDMRERRMSHASYGQDLAIRHKDYYRDLGPLRAEKADMLSATAAVSHAQQASIEANDRIEFAEYLRAYFAAHGD